MERICARMQSFKRLKEHFTWPKCTPRMGGHGFDPGPNKTNGTGCSTIDTRICGGGGDLESVLGVWGSIK